jgi:hypothetical protein
MTRFTTWKTKKKGVAAAARVQNVWMDKKAEELQQQQQQQPGQAKQRVNIRHKPVVFLPVTVT